MKTKQLFILSVVLLVFAGCAVKIPDTDTTPPQITVSITGPGVRVTFNSQAQADRKQINLQHGGLYTINSIVTDNGGVSRHTFYTSIPPTDATFGEFKDQNSNVITQTLAPLRTMYTIRGNRAAPKSGLIINGSITFPASLGTTAFDLFTEGTDFGGRAATSNLSVLTIHCLTDRVGAVVDL